MEIEKDTDLTDQYLQELIYSMNQKNLVYNYNFKYFSNKTVNESGLIDYKHPDGWRYNDSGSGAQISLADDKYCRIVTSNDNTSVMTFAQSLHEFPRWEDYLKGKIITAKVHMNISKNCKLTVMLSDGISNNTKSLTGNGDIEIDLNLLVDENAKELSITIQSKSNSAVIKISKVYANVGNIAIETLTCIVEGTIGERKQYIATENPPAEELSLCTKTKELSSEYSRLNSILNKKFGAGPNNYSLLPDMRGYFSRAWNHNSETDPDAQKRSGLSKSIIKGDHVSTMQDDEFYTHTHKLDFSTGIQIPPGKEGVATIVDLNKPCNTQQTGGNETRPKNIAELYTIKWA
jgi:hypothetical protein